MSTSAPTIPIEISARHAHLNAADWQQLFGDAPIAPAKLISQHGQFIAQQRVELRGPKDSIAEVGVVGPLREYTQVELAKTDARRLGYQTLPLTDSGQLDQAATITIIGPQGSIEVPAAIIQQRHIHASPAEAEQYGLQDRQITSVDIAGPRGGRFDQVLVRIHPDYAWALHLDTDEANAMGIASGDLGTLVV